VFDFVFFAGDIIVLASACRRLKSVSFEGCAGISGATRERHENCFFLFSSLFLVVCIITALSSGNVSAVARLPECTVALFKGCWGTYSGPFEINLFFSRWFHFVWLMGVFFLRINERPPCIWLCAQMPKSSRACAW
jgi:hypothetical protein